MTAVTIIYNDGFNQQITAGYYNTIIKGNEDKLNIFDVMISKKETLKQLAEKATKENNYKELENIIILLKIDKSYTDDGFNSRNYLH